MIRRFVCSLLGTSVLVCGVAAAQVPAPTGLGSGRQLEGDDTARDQGHGHPDAGAARPRALRGKRARQGRPSARPAHDRPRRSAQQSAGRRGRQPVQLFARSADLHPRIREPLQLRRPRPQGAAGRRATDAARRAEPAHQRRVRHDRARRSPARRQLRPLRQRLRWRHLARNGAGGPGAVRDPGARGGRHRQLERRRLLQVAELVLWSLRQRQRHALPLAIQDRRLSPAQRRRDSPAQRGRRLRLFRLDPRHAALQRRRRSDRRESRRPHPRRIPRQSRFRRGHQHRPARRQGRPAAAALARTQARRRRRHRVRTLQSSACCAT